MRVVTKLTLAINAGILVVHAGSAAVRVEREQALFREDVARDARLLARVVAHQVERAWLIYGEDEALELIDFASDRESHVHMRWVWLDAAPGKRDAPLADAETLQPLTHGRSVVARTRMGSSELMIAYAPVRQPSGRVGAVEVSDRLDDDWLYLRRSMANAVISAVVMVLLCSAVVWLLGERLLGRPVRRLVHQARAIGRGDLSTRLDAAEPGELGELGREMNQMSANLQEAHHRLQSETEARVKAREQLRHADRLTTIGTLASGVAHELGTPINIIEGHAQLIGEDPLTRDKTREHVQVIVRQCKRMAQVIRQLLDFARAGGRSSAPTDVHSVVVGTLHMVAPLLHKQNVETVIDDEGFSVQVSIGAHALQQVLTNLVINGMHAMPSGGTLTVRIGRRRAAPPGPEPHEQDCAAVSVCDTGEGMNEEVSKRAFEPFFTTKDVGQGTGLGLSVAYGIVKDHGGWLGVDSEPGRGSTFTIFLPSEHSA